ncbi:uncharacterized protein V1516DRAFT_678623 [Lipomyces oligophaga]|uniref:uncharacterized protein n=1 Tax=Lipomyces oligophaga TaxID=45792 RepID=UPI0034CEF8B4
MDGTTQDFADEGEYYSNMAATGEATSEYSNVIDIPLRDDSEVVTMNLDTDLPDDPTELCDLLENEEAGRQFWLAIGTAYSRFGKIEEAIEVIQRGLNAPAIMRGSKTEQTPFRACLAWLYLKQYRDAPATADSALLKQLKPTLKKDYATLATRELNLTMEAYPSWNVNLLGRGVLTMLRGTLDSALRVFDETLKSSAGASNLIAYFGRARVLYSRGNYEEALRLYQQILVSRPNLKPDPRIGIGLCFWQLGFKDDAQMAWSRSLELDPENTSATLLLGLYYQDKAFHDLTSPEFVKTYGLALEYAQRSYKNTAQRMSLAGLVLVRYLFSRRDQMDTVIKLCERILDFSTLPTITAEAYFWMARASHFQNDYSKAQQWYGRAQGPEFENMLAAVGFGQIQIIKNELTEAKLTFERIIQQYPKCAEGVLMLGYLYAQDYVQGVSGPTAGKHSASSSTSGQAVASEKAKAMVLLERYIKLVESRPGVTPTEISVYVTLSQLFESENLDKAIAWLEKALALQSRLFGEKNVQEQLLNNLGVLYYHKGQFAQAQEKFKQALASDIVKKGEEEERDARTLTITYNLGRLEEESGNLDEAKKLYSEIREKTPGYVDVRIRMCYITLKEAERAGTGEKSKALTEEAGKIIQDLVENESDNLEVRALHGWYTHQQQQRRPVSKAIADDPEFRHYKHTLQYYDKHDVYSLTAMGNVHLAIAREMKPTNEQEVQRRKKMYEKAVEFFDKSLQLDSQNAYAAEGIAIALAEDKKYNKAVGIFSKIRETLKDVAAYINLGHCLTELKNYSRAIECYEIALERFQGGRNIQTMMCLGRVWLQRGMEELSVESVETAIRYSQKALEQSPSNLALKFNVAFCEFQLAEVVRRKPIADSNVETIEKAASGLEEAIQLLTELAGASHPPYPAAEIQQRANMGQNTTRRQLERVLAQRKEYEERSEAKLEAARLARHGTTTVATGGSNGTNEANETARTSATTAAMSVDAQA